VEAIIIAIDEIEQFEWLCAHMYAYRSCLPNTKMTRTRVRRCTTRLITKTKYSSSRDTGKITKISSMRSVNIICHFLLASARLTTQPKSIQLNCWQIFCHHFVICHLNESVSSQLIILFSSYFFRSSFFVQLNSGCLKFLY